VIARVGNAELTIADAKAHIDTSQVPFGDQLQRYVVHWVNEELLYQEAQRRGIGNSDELEHQIQDARRQLIADAFVQRQVYLDDTTSVSDSVLRAYYALHTAEFIVSEDLVKLNLAIFNARDRASKFSAQVMRGSLWDDAIAATIQDTVAQSGLVSNVRGQYFSQRTIFPLELWKVAAALDVNDVSFPIRTSGGYCVIQLLEQAQEGKPASLDVARDEVRDRVLIARRRQCYEDLLGTLRKRYTVEIMSTVEKQKDTSNRLHE
jgi:peptidyl-prolyl cis-trans isomerase C